MLPLSDSVARRQPPFVTWGLIAINVLVFLHELALPPPARALFLRIYALVPADYAGSGGFLAHPLDYYPFLTNAFLHGGWLHLIFNMWTLWLFAPAVEDRLGAWRFLSFYLGAAIAASATHAFFNRWSGVPALGASGAIAGVIGCYARLFPFARLLLVVPILFFPFFFEVPALVFAALWFLMQMLPGLLSLAMDQPAGGIAWWAHIGGFAAGWLAAPWLARSGRMRRRYYDDEGIFGFLPDGRRDRRPWR
jgi:membrane associated rhomboid family serine protease